MNKPFSVANEEFKQKLANLINNAGLPICVIELTLQNCLNEISNVARNQYRADKVQYEKSLLEESNKDKKSDKE